MILPDPATTASQKAAEGFIQAPPVSGSDHCGGAFAQLFDLIAFRLARTAGAVSLAKTPRSRLSSRPRT